ncbi:hypothetical protein P1X14_04835 [Sphingomonas sp. AOB5]|uniref:hypothetical protein n=1 Tax=Sphingomonas sp. AOB5 TaxID=3034017 RepID=UPI0023F70D4B|nr:hypothetical protein [Sphingomonas sp. AOB5]MDF7774563.1 hypothetical protein [Sphingomonas sp. AOB5]
MIAGFSDFISRVVSHLKELGGARAAALAVGLAGLAYATDKLVSDKDSLLAKTTGLDRDWLLIGLFLLSVMLVTWIIIVEWPSVRRIEGLHTPGEMVDAKSDDLEEKRERSPALTEAVLTQLIPTLFPSAEAPEEGITMPGDDVRAAGEKNRYMLVGLYSRKEARFVGYASFWPVRDEIGEKLIKGEMTDSDLRAEHVLGEDERHLCNYAIVPGIGVIGKTTKLRNHRGIRLVRTLKKMIAAEYLNTPGRKITMIAIGYSDPGRAWCKLLEMKQESEVTYGDGKYFPVFARAMTVDDLL